MFLPQRKQKPFQKWKRLSLHAPTPCYYLHQCHRVSRSLSADISQRLCVTKTPPESQEHDTLAVSHIEKYNKRKGVSDVWDEAK